MIHSPVLHTRSVSVIYPFGNVKTKYGQPIYIGTHAWYKLNIFPKNSTCLVGACLPWSLCHSGCLSLVRCLLSFCELQIMYVDKSDETRYIFFLLEHRLVIS